MTLGETLDEIREDHLRAGALAGETHGEYSSCELCRALARIQKAYEEMIQSLNVLDTSPSLPEGYQSALDRDSEWTGTVSIENPTPGVTREIK